MYIYTHTGDGVSLSQIIGSDDAAAAAPCQWLRPLALSLSLSHGVGHQSIGCGQLWSVVAFGLVAKGYNGERAITGQLWLLIKNKLIAALSPKWMQSPHRPHRPFSYGRPPASIIAKEG